jgi:integrase
MGLNITKSGTNLWFLNVRIRKDGKELRRRETFNGTKSQAEGRFIDLKRELREGSKTFQPDQRKLAVFRDVLELYRQRREAQGEVDKPRYRALDRDLGDVPLNVFPDRLEAYLKHLRTTPSPATSKPLSNGTLNRFVALIRTAFGVAVDLELIDKCPLSKYRFPKLREVSRDRVLSLEERRRLLNVIEKEEPHLLAIVQYALQVPCRKSELVNMRREDLDLINESIRVRNGTTKNDHGCDKPIPPNMIAYFRSLPSGCPWLFYRKEKDGYHSLGCFNKAWYKSLRLAGVRNFRFHDTRHNAATALLDSGTPEQVVLVVAGWKTNMLKTYYHRDGKKSLTLVRFADTGSGHIVDTVGAKAA